MSAHNISVIIPNYNHAAYLKQRIDSVLNQTLQPTEIIILDDCSTDNSVEIIEKYVSQHRNIQFIKNEINSGSPFAQWNKGIQLATGNLIWVAESDDTALPNFLEKIINCFKMNDSLSLAYCESNKINEDEFIVGSCKAYSDEFDSNLFKHDFIINGKEFIERFLIHKNIIPNASGVVFKKNIFESINGATPSFKYQGDWLIWLQLLCYGNIAYISDVLNNFRVHQKSNIAIAHASKNQTHFVDWYAFEIRIFFLQFIKKNKIKLSSKLININANYISIDRGNFGLHNIKNKNYLKGLKLIFQASFFPKFKSGFIKKLIFKTTK